MRKKKIYKYKNYGPIPQNEYAAANPAENPNTAADLGDDPLAGDTAPDQHRMKLQALRPSGRRRILGWARTWKSNGWRAEAALQDDELTDIGRNSSDV